jgi:hypothetical protein
VTGPTVGFLHTAEVHVATFDGLVAAQHPGARTWHAVAPDLLADARRAGTGTADETGDDTGDDIAGAPPAGDLGRRTLAALTGLVEQGADVVVCTCSTLGPVVERLAERVGVPVLRVDRPMARAAVACGPVVGVVAALASTVGPTRDLLDDEASRDGGREVVAVVVPGAWDAFEAGDTDGYERLVEAAARALAPTVDVVVLAQASMAGAADRLRDLGLTVLTRPGPAVRAALEAARP